MKQQLIWRAPACVLLLAACTPLGLWLYEDPVVTVHRVTFELSELGSAEGSPVHVALAVKNRNDYPLAAERVELTLRMNGVPIGRLDHAKEAEVATDTISTVTMPLALEARTTRKQLEALGAGSHVFAVRGRATFRTPIGVRKVRFAQEGPMVFGERSASLSP
jgi:LEA14-like dessication related protein